MVLGIDPGSARNCGWALVNSECVVKAGVVAANGHAIEALAVGRGLCSQDYDARFDLLAYEGPHGQFYNVAKALNRVIGRWLSLAERLQVPTLEVKPSEWMAMFLGAMQATPRTVLDSKTGKKRKLNKKEKAAGKKTREEFYRLHAVDQLGLDPTLPADAAAAAWVARYAIETWEG